MTAAGRHLALDLARAEQVRRTVGPTPLVVLEVVAGRSVASPPVVEIGRSTRDLAKVLGLLKDTVERALRMLARADLVRRVDCRSERTGQFTATTYAVDLAASGLTLRAEDGLSDTAAEVAGPTGPATDTLRTVGRQHPQLEHDAARLADGTTPDERSVIERPADPVSESEPASSQLSLLA